MSLPLVDAPPVAERVVIIDSADKTPQSLDATPPAVDVVSPPPSPIGASSLRQIIHSSPDHNLLTSQITQPIITAPELLPPLFFTLDDIFATRIATLRHIPKTAQREMASLKNRVWNDFLRNPDDEYHLVKAFAYTKLILFLPPGKRHFKEKSAVVKQRISRFLDGRLNDLWKEATRPVRGKKRTSPPSTSGNARRATDLAREGQYGQAAKALISQGLDFDSEEAVENMRSKHPSSPPPPPLPPSNTPPYSIKAEEVLSALNSFHSLSAGGPSGMRPAHFKEAVASDQGHSLLPTLTRVVNSFAAGRISNTLKPYLSGGNLFAAIKKNGGHRPIAVGEVLRRLTSKCIARKATADTSDYLAPHQLGVGVKGGAEAAIHAAHAIFSDADIPTDRKYVLQVDFANAFNNIDRMQMLAEIRRQCPKASAWAEVCYAQSSHLFFGNHRLSSSSGAQQGDPLASLLFALTLHPLLLRIKDEHPNLLLHVFFLDDGTFIGTMDDLQSVFDILSKAGPEIGLLLNAAKSSVWCGDNLPSNIDPTDPLQRGVPPASPAGYHLLGAPIGDISFSRGVVDKRIAKIAEIFDLLPSLNDAQLEFSLLRFCFSLPKLSYCLRTCDPLHLLPSYQNFDSLQLSSFSTLLGRQLDDAARTQAFLPVKIGGSGLRSANQHCSAAFIASNAHTRNIVDSLLPPRIERRSTLNAFPLLQQNTGNPTYTNTDLLPPDFTQHSLSIEIDTFARSSLLNNADSRNKARLHSLNLPHAGDWVDAPPSSSLNLTLDSRSFGAVMGFRLGLPLLTASECRAPNCDQQQDSYGDHAMHCRDDHGIKISRHDRIRDRIFQEAQRASLNPIKEVPGLIPGTLSRPGDIGFESWIDGRKMAFDVSVVSPTQDAILHRAAEAPASAIEMRKTSKNRTHFENCRGQGIIFKPLVVETFGGWDAEAVTYLKQLGRHSARRWGKLDSMEIKHFFQRLSIALQRGNASLLLDRDPA